MKTLLNECGYTYENSTYIFNIYVNETHYNSSILAISSRDSALSWGLTRQIWLKKSTESKALLDEDRRTDESVMVILSYDIGDENNPVNLPLLIVKNDSVLYDIGDSMQPTE